MNFPFQGQKFFYVALHQIAKEIRISVISPMGVLEPACLVRLVVQNVLLISLWIMNMEYKLARTNVNEGVCINTLRITLLVYI